MGKTTLDHADLVALLDRVHPHILSQVEAEHMLDGFGPRKWLQIDEVLHDIDTALTALRSGADMMGKWEPLPSTSPCFFNCGAVLYDKFNAREIVGWLWFTHYGTDPVHFCHNCRLTRAKDIHEIEMALTIRPPDYPKVRATIPERFMAIARTGKL